MLFLTKAGCFIPLFTFEFHMQFTCEIEENSILPFLDIQLHHNNDGSISTSVYHKPTHTGQYLDFSSCHLISSKASVVKTLLHQAKVLSSSNTALQDEESYIFKNLISSYYPQDFITSFNIHTHTIQTQDSTTTTIVLPYISGIPDPLKEFYRGLL